MTRIEQAKHIQKMIEEVARDTNVVSKLHEINARVWCLITERPYETNFGIDEDGDLFCKNKFYDEKYGRLLNFMTSLDAIKAIEPEGWYMHYGENSISDMWICYFYHPKIDRVESPFMPTECSARLHAILSAYIHIWSEEDV